MGMAEAHGPGGIPPQHLQSAPTSVPGMGLLGPLRRPETCVATAPCGEIRGEMRVSYVPRGHVVRFFEPGMKAGLCNRDSG